MQNIRVCVGVFIVKNDNEILLGKRKYNPGEGEHTLPGGHLKSGERIIDCAKREVFEETGLNIRGGRFISLVNMPTLYSNFHYLTICLSAEWISGEPENKEPEKCEGWEWYPLDGLPEIIFGLRDTEITKHFLLGKSYVDGL